VTGYAEKRARIAAEVRSAGGPVGLGKRTSNLFRHREHRRKRLLEVGDLTSVLAVDARAGSAEVEGMAPYAALVDATLAHGCLPAVVPELKSITVGGAAAGVGIESSSFRYGLMHETVLEMEILLAGGEVVTCRPDNEHADLFFGFPNSYGTLGYALKLAVATVPAAPYVALEHRRHRDPERYFEALAEACALGDADFIDGTVFAADELYITLGRFADRAPYTSDYGFEKMYYRSIRERGEDYLTARDYVWRWDTDWFWCSKNVYAQNPVVRRLLGRKRLGSVTYTRIMRLNGRLGLTRRLNRLLGIRTETVIQDVDIPVDNASAFLGFFLREVPIVPVWICPLRAVSPRGFDLYPLAHDTPYVNFGFWDIVRSEPGHEPGHYNRKVEDKVAELGGIKSLYSDVFYDRERFWSIYNRPAYERLKARYDPQGRLGDLYEKCVLRR